MTNLKRAARRTALLAATALLLAGAGDREDRLSQAFGAYLSGRLALQTHDLKAAADAFETVLRDDPGTKEVQNQAFLAALLVGQGRAAKLAALLPDNPLAQLVLGDRDGKAGRWSAAEARFAGLSEQQTLTQVLRPLLLAWAQQGQGRTQAALNTLAPFVSGRRFQGVYALHAAMIADLGGRTDQAARLYGMAKADYGRANLRLGIILASWQARHGQAAAAKQTIDDVTGGDGDLAMVRAALEAKMAELAVSNAAQGIAEAYLALAATLHLQNAPTAQLVARLALEMRPDLTAARLLLAEIEGAQGQPQAALTTLAAIAADDPLAPMVALRKAALLAQSGQPDAADQILHSLAKAYPDRPEPYAQQGDILRNQQKFAAAAQAYSEAISRLGTPHRANWPLFYARGIAYDRAGNWPKAQADLQYALKLAPDEPSVLNYLGYSWADRGEHLEQARGMLERAVAARPKEGALVDSLGWVLLRLGHTNAAIAQLEHAVELEPEDAVINGHLGDALAAAGRKREAAYQWRRALTFKPDSDEANALREKLAKLAASETGGTAPPAVPR